MSQPNKKHEKKSLMAACHKYLMRLGFEREQGTRVYNYRCGDETYSVILYEILENETGGFKYKDRKGDIIYKCEVWGQRQCKTEVKSIKIMDIEGLKLLVEGTLVWREMQLKINDTA